MCSNTTEVNEVGLQLSRTLDTRKKSGASDSRQEISYRHAALSLPPSHSPNRRSNSEIISKLTRFKATQILNLFRCVRWAESFIN